MARVPTRRKPLSLETLLSLAAVITSICALGITFYQAYLQRMQQFASVMPVLDTYLNNGEINNGRGYEFELILVNYGVGPAFIKDFEFTFLGKTFRGDGTVRSAIQQLRAELKIDSSTVLFSGLWPGRIVPTGQEIKLLSVKEPRLAQALDSGQNQIGLRISYESIYGETWRFDPAARSEQRITKLD